MGCPEARQRLPSDLRQCTGRFQNPQNCGFDRIKGVCVAQGQVGGMDCGAFFGSLQRPERQAYTTHGVERKGLWGMRS